MKGGYNMNRAGYKKVNMGKYVTDSYSRKDFKKMVNRKIRHVKIKIYD